jgi:predicted amidophosphoribosyltransferase
VTFDPMGLVRALALSLTRCPGCALRPPAAHGCCDACWRTMLRPTVTTDVLALGAYPGALGAVLRRAKFGGARLALDALGDRLGELLEAAGYVALPVVPVPSHAARRRRRGSDPSAHLAERAAGPRVLHALHRTRPGRPQSRSLPHEREANVAHSFAPTAAAEALPRGARVVLLDDVLTSGATARACKGALASIDVHVAVVAVAALS